jgi:YfiH family protein
MRGSLKLPQVYESAILKDPRVVHRFFYKNDCEGQEVDFSSPLSDELAAAMLDEFKLKHLLVLNQNHTAGIVSYPGDVLSTQADGVITNQKGVGLLIRHADCQAALIFDPVRCVIGAVHAGFKGQILGIYTQVIEAMKTQYRSDPATIYVALSASLGVESSEFTQYKEQFPLALHSYFKDNHADLKQMALDELIACGCLKEHISIDPRCTKQQSSLFFSYRFNKTKKRLGSLIVLN